MWRVEESQLPVLGLGFPPGTELGNYYEALARYRFVAGLVGGKKILDVGCGSGYGAFCLAHIAASVTAVDNDEACIRQATDNYTHDNLVFHRMNGTLLRFADRCFDMVLSLQVIEWMNDPGTYIRELRRVCKDNGLCVLSWLNAERPVKPINLHPNHVSEYTIGEMSEILSDVFQSMKVYTQRNWWTVGQQELSSAGRFRSKMRVLLKSPHLLATTVRRQAVKPFVSSLSVLPVIEDSVFDAGVKPDAKFFVAICEA